MCCLEKNDTEINDGSDERNGLVGTKGAVCVGGGGVTESM